MRRPFLPKGHPGLARTSRGQQGRGAVHGVGMQLEDRFAQLAPSEDEAQQAAEHHHFAQLAARGGEKAGDGGQKVGAGSSLASVGRREENFGAGAELRADLVSILEEAEQKLEMFNLPGAKHFFTEGELGTFASLVAFVRRECMRSVLCSPMVLEQKIDSVKEVMEQMVAKYKEKELLERLEKEAEVQNEEAKKRKQKFRKIEALANTLDGVLNEAEKNLEVFKSPSTLHFFSGTTELHTFGTLVGFVRSWYNSIQTDLGRVEDMQNFSFSANELEQQTKAVKEVLQQLSSKYETKLKEQADNEARVQAEEAKKEAIGLVEHNGGGSSSSTFGSEAVTRNAVSGQFDREKMNFYSVNKMVMRDYNRLASVFQRQKDGGHLFTVEVNLPTGLVRRGKDAIQNALVEEVRLQCNNRYASYFDQLINAIWWPKENFRWRSFVDVHIMLKRGAQMNDAVWVANFFEQFVGFGGTGLLAEQY